MTLSTIQDSLPLIQLKRLLLSKERKRKEKGRAEKEYYHLLQRIEPRTRRRNPKRKRNRKMADQGIFLGDGPVRRYQSGGSNPLMRKIQRACRFSLPEPDLALNLDVADYINEKQGGAAYDAVNTIVKLINNRDTHTAVFALALLDVLVKNCGYPVHLQISRKEFLNELVKRFPEHPPMRYSKVQRLILTAIEEWYQTICKHSPYKEDLTFIKDMRRLLKYKGYILPKINAEDLAVMRPTEHLKTASEIQKEQEIAQAAKLEELIRSGKPEDLREANKLMKIMAGFKEDNIIQAKQAINTELNKLKRKANLLNDMLNSSSEADLRNNETVEELYGALKGAQPKFQKIIEEEHDDDKLVQSLLKFNDTVNQLLEKYSLIKIGNKAAADKIKPETSTEADTAIAAKANAGALANEINLIDFGDSMGGSGTASETVSSGQGAGAAGNSTAMMDLLGDLNDLTISPGNGASSKPVHLDTQMSNLLDMDTAPSATTNTGITSPPASAPSNTQNVMGEMDLLGSSTSQSSSTKVLVSQSSVLKLFFEIARESDTTIRVKALISNLSTSLLSNVVFSVAVPKSKTLRMEPQSSDSIQGGVQSGITQLMWIDNATVIPPNGKPLSVKWRITYTTNGNPGEETAVFKLPNV